jgi:hypothetical protein
MRICRMRTGISFSVTAADLDRLRGLVKDRNAPQKHVWRARIVLLTAEGFGTTAVLKFLNSGCEREHKKVAAELRRFAGIEPPPFVAQLLDVERSNAIDLSFDRSWVRPSHGYAASVGRMECMLAAASIVAELARPLDPRPAADVVSRPSGYRGRGRWLASAVRRRRLCARTSARRIGRTQEIARPAQCRQALPIAPFRRPLWTLSPGVPIGGKSAPKRRPYSIKLRT